MIPFIITERALIAVWHFIYHEFHRWLFPPLIVVFVIEINPCILADILKIRFVIEHVLYSLPDSRAIVHLDKSLDVAQIAHSDILSGRSSGCSISPNSAVLLMVNSV